MAASSLTAVTEVSVGSTVVLNCNSNDYKHNFLFWLFDKNQVVGPGNNYDDKKYKYEVLSGRLHIHSVSPEESGYYKCVSKNVDNFGFSVGQIEMIVNGFSPIDAVRLVAIIISIIVIIGCAIMYFRLRKEWSKYDGAAIVPVEDNEDEDDEIYTPGDEIYNRTTKTISQPVAGPSRNLSSDQLLYGIDNQGLDTDFNSVFENIQVKSPQASLI